MLKTTPVNCVAPTPIDYTGIERADALLVLSEDGLRKSGPYLRSLAPDATVFALPGLGDLPGFPRLLVRVPR